MNAILGMLQLLQCSALDARQRDYAARIDGAARSLLALLNDILDFSKVEAGKMALDPQPFLLDQLLSEVEVILQATRGEKPLWLAVERDPVLPPCLLGDALRLKQILINLGGNAIKFTAEGEVSLRLAQVWRLADRVCLSVEVRDTGISIAPEHQQQIFTGFSQAEAATTRRYGGTGLGLAISQRLVQLMGAELTLQSELGKGSCFSFTLELPVVEALALPSATAALPQRGATRRLSGLRLLLVEDNPNNQLVARELLQDEGALVELAENGLQALQRLDQMLAQGEPRFDAVLMDVQMPVMDGFTATRRLRERPELATLPVVAISANVMATDRAQCLAAGMNEHVGKPFDLDLLVALLQRLCGRTSSGALALTEAADLGLPAALLQEAEQAGLDLPGALKRLGGRCDLLARMARSFASSTEALAGQLRSLPAEEVARALHGLKGVAGNLGARHLAEMAGQGEQQLRQGRPLEPAWIEALEQQRRVASQTLQGLIQSLPLQPDASAPAPAPAPDRDAAREALLALSRLLQDSDMAALDALDTLRRAHGNGLDEAALDALDQAVLQLDFAQAARHCAALLDTLG